MSQDGVIVRFADKLDDGFLRTGCQTFTLNSSKRCFLMNAIQSTHINVSELSAGALSKEVNHNHSGPPAEGDRDSPL